MINNQPHLGLVVDTNHVIGWKESKVIGHGRQQTQPMDLWSKQNQKEEGRYDEPRWRTILYLSHVFDDLLSPRENPSVINKQDHHIYRCIRNVHMSTYNWISTINQPYLQSILMNLFVNSPFRAYFEQSNWVITNSYIVRVFFFIN